MLKTLSSLLFIAVLSLPGIALASNILDFEATLNGDQSVPGPVSTSASGSAPLKLNDVQTRLEIEITIVGLDLDGLQTPGNPDDDVLALHIHRGQPGTAGPVVFGFIGPDSDLNGDLAIDPVEGTIVSAWDLTEGNETTLSDELASLMAEGLYFNVHTPVNLPGEIRGQITLVDRVPEPAASSLLVVGALAGMLLRRRAGPLARSAA